VTLLGAALTTQSRVAAAIIAAGFILFLLELIRRHRLRERYALLWLATGAGMLLIAAFPQILAVPNDLLGVRTPALALVVIGFLALMMVVLHLTAELSQQGDQITRLAQELAIERAQRQEHQTDAAVDEAAGALAEASRSAER
jgi:hypothetical protein